jgi:hypothetical protein
VVSYDAETILYNSKGLSNIIPRCANGTETIAKIEDVRRVIYFSYAGLSKNVDLFWNYDGDKAEKRTTMNCLKGETIYFSMLGICDQNKDFF